MLPVLCNLVTLRGMSPNPPSQLALEKNSIILEFLNDMPACYIVGESG